MNPERPIEVGAQGIIARRANVGILIVCGATVPSDGTKGYATGCVFIHTGSDDGGGDLIHINGGTIDSCSFDSLDEVLSL